MPVTRRRSGLVALLSPVVVLGLVACAPGMTTTGAGATSTTVDRGPQNSTPPNLVFGVEIPSGRVEEAVARLDARAQDLVRRSGIPGMAVAVVHDGKVLFAKGFGVRKVGAPEPVDADTVFQLASVSKPLGATVVAGAVGGGGVTWDDPVVRHVPGFEMSDPYVTRNVTIADLYAHRSGLPDHALDNLEDLGASQPQVQAAMKYVPLARFRDNYEYTNAGLTVAGEAVARAKGMTWEELSQQVLFRPLAMASTSFTLAGFESRSNRAYGHVKEGETYVAKYVRDPDAEQPAGGASSSVNDLAKWLSLRLDEGRYDGTQVIDADALLATTEPASLSNPARLPAARPGFYGLGMNVGTDPSSRVTWSHSGAFALGAGTAITLLPAEHLGIVTLTNASPTGTAEALNASFIDDVEFGRQTRDWYAAYGPVFERLSQPHGALVGTSPPASPAPPLPLTSYAGRYRNDVYGTAEVSVGGGELRLTVGPKGETFPLRHWDGSTFAWTPPGENGGFPTSIVFRTGPGGAVTGFVSEHMDDDGTGLFPRT